MSARTHASSVSSLASKTGSRPKPSTIATRRLRTASGLAAAGEKGDSRIRATSVDDAAVREARASSAMPEAATSAIAVAVPK